MFLMFKRKRDPIGDIMNINLVTLVHNTQISLSIGTCAINTKKKKYFSNDGLKNVLRVLWGPHTVLPMVAVQIIHARNQHGKRNLSWAQVYLLPWEGIWLCVSYSQLPFLHLWYRNKRRYTAHERVFQAVNHYVAINYSENIKANSRLRCFLITGHIFLWDNSYFAYNSTI